MLRLVSLLGMACLAVAAVAVASSSSSTKNKPAQDPSIDVKSRFAVTVVPVVPSYYAPFSLN